MKQHRQGDRGGQNATQLPEKFSFVPTSRDEWHLHLSLPVNMSPIYLRFTGISSPQDETLVYRMIKWIKFLSPDGQVRAEFTGRELMYEIQSRVLFTQTVLPPFWVAFPEFQNFSCEHIHLQLNTEWLGLHHDIQPRFYANVEFDRSPVSPYFFCVNQEAQRTELDPSGLTVIPLDLSYTAQVCFTLHENDDSFVSICDEALQCTLIDVDGKVYFSRDHGDFCLLAITGSRLMSLTHPRYCFSLGTENWSPPTVWLTGHFLLRIQLPPASRARSVLVWTGDWRGDFEKNS